MQHEAKEHQDVVQASQAPRELQVAGASSSEVGRSSLVEAMTSSLEREVLGHLLFVCYCSCRYQTLEVLDDVEPAYACECWRVFSRDEKLHRRLMLFYFSFWVMQIRCRCPKTTKTQTFSAPTLPTRHWKHLSAQAKHHRRSWHLW